MGCSEALEQEMNTRTIRYLPQGGLEIIEIDVPDPQPWEVQVKATACGICKWDIATYRLGSEDRWAAPDGHEGVGVICKVGRDVHGLKEGDRVANGSFAGYRNYWSGSVQLIPECDIPDEHWIVEPVSCVVNGLDTAKLLPADRVAVIGCGFMGLMFVQALGRSLVDRLIAIDVDESKLALAGEFGATDVANPKEPGFDGRVQELHALGIDKVIDCTGSQEGLLLSTRLVRPGGLISLSGWIRGEGRFPGTDWHMGGFTVVNSAPGCRIRDSVPAAMRLLHRKQIDLAPLVTDVVPLEGLQGLLEGLSNGRTRPYIKGVVKLDG